MTTTHLVLGLAVAVGAMVQGSIGFGTAVVAAPFVVVWAPEVMPVAILVTSLALPVIQLVHGPREVLWRPLSWALVGRALLTPVGVWLVAAFSPDLIATLVGILLLLTVWVSVSRIHVAATSTNALVAGGLAGISGTAASIGGPFLAVALQHETPVRVRSTLSWFFLVGSAMGLIGLVLGGQGRSLAVEVGLLWVPFALLGYLASQPVRRLLPAHRLRSAVLTFCVLAGVGVIVRALVV